MLDKAVLRQSMSAARREANYLTFMQRQAQQWKPFYGKPPLRNLQRIDVLAACLHKDATKLASLGPPYASLAIQAKAYAVEVEALLAQLILQAQRSPCQTPLRRQRSQRLVPSRPSRLGLRKD